MQVAFQLYSFQWFIILALIYIINWIDAIFPHSRETWSKSNDLYQHLALQMFQNRQHRRKKEGMVDQRIFKTAKNYGFDSVFFD